MKAYDFVFETPGGYSFSPQAQSFQLTVPPGAASGWIGSAGPAIAPATWPRGTRTGLPMFHAVTLRLPVEYQRNGPGLPGIAFFQGEGQFAEESSPDPSDPFVLDVAAASPHPQLNRRTDIIGGQFALIWLTEAELAGGPTRPPADSRRPGEHLADDEGPNAWDTQQPTAAVWLTARTDPNAGIAPVELPDPDADTDYEGLFTADWQFKPWAAPLAGRCHLGGTTFPVQGLPEDLTPYYLELEELPGLNFGGGNAQLDLESETFDWACD